MSIAFLMTLAAGPGAPLAHGSAPDIPWVRMVLVLILCLALAVAAIGFVRLRHGMSFLPDRLPMPTRSVGKEKNSPEKLTITERLGAGPSSQFVILKRGKQNYLLHISQTGATEIDRFRDEEADAEGNQL